MPFSRLAAQTQRLTSLYLLLIPTPRQQPTPNARPNPSLHSNHLSPFTRTIPPPRMYRRYHRRASAACWPVTMPQMRVPDAGSASASAKLARNALFVSARGRVGLAVSARRRMLADHSPFSPVPQSPCCFSSAVRYHCFTPLDLRVSRAYLRAVLARLTVGGKTEKGFKQRIAQINIFFGELAASISTHPCMRTYCLICSSDDIHYHVKALQSGAIMTETPNLNYV